jgi:hypothetical protein
MGNPEQESVRLFYALIELDMNYVREMVPEMTNDAARLVCLHKARYEHTGVPAEYRHASRAWLEQNGFSRYKQLPWPPAGELPR